MEDWKILVGNQTFISDLGAHQTAEVHGERTRLGRYAVWSPVSNANRHQVIEVGEDLDALMRKYQVPKERVLRLVRADST
jgi:hypothetical protein